MKNWKKIFSIILPTIGIILSLCVFAYYPLSEMMDAKQREKIIENLDLETQSQPSEKKNEMLLQARSYNELLAKETPEMPQDLILPYEQQLSAGSPDSAFAWIKIPKINLEMPIYHTTSNEALAQGVGHMETSSLPIGGASTHAVLSAHSGMPNERAFDDIRDLQVGDFFAVCVLNDWYGYQVDSIETVLPYEMDSLDIVPGEDRMTLITCTPYGINDHRLLVHARRTELPDDFYQQKASVIKTVTNRRVWPFLAAFAAVLATVLFIVWRSRRNARQKKGSSR